MKAKYITAENYREFKPSDFVRSFVSDIEVAQKIGKPMDMTEWVGNGCLPCLGGMACLNMGIDPFDYGVGDAVSVLGDKIRLGWTDSVWERVEELFDISLPFVQLPSRNKKGFDGEIKTEKQFNALKAQVNYYADALKKAGF